MDSMNCKRDNIELVELSHNNYGEWDTFISRISIYSLFNSSLWCETLSKVTKKEYRIIGVYKDKVLVGGCCLFIRRTPEGTAVVHPLLTPYTGLFIEPRESAYSYKVENEYSQIINCIIDYLESNFDYAVLINSPQIIDIRPFIWRGWIPSVRYTYHRKKDDIFPLSKDIERRAAYAKDNGVFIEQGNDVKKFYQLLSKTFQRQKTVFPLNESQFAELFNELYSKSAVKMLLARTKENEIISGTLLLVDQDRIFYWVAASESNLLDTGGNQLLIKEIIEKIVPEYSFIDFVGADIESIAAYKSTFGARLISHYQVSKAVSLRAKTVRLIKDLFHGFVKV